MPVSVPPGSSLSEQIYGIGATIEAERAVRAMAFMGRDETSGFFLRDEFRDQRGSNVKIRFRPRRHGMAPDPRGTTVVGNAPTRQYVEDDLSINYFQLAKGELDLEPHDQQHVSLDLKGIEQSSMAAECSEILEAWIMNQLMGNTAVNGVTNFGLSGGNAAREPDTAHWLFAPDNTGANLTEAAVAADTSSVLTNRIVDEAVKRMHSIDYVRWPVVPASTPWGDYYVCLCHGEGMQQVKENNTDSDIFPLTVAEIQGGMSIDDTWLGTGEGFILGKVLYLETDYAPKGTTGTANSTTTSSAQANVRRAAVFGARALHIGFGEAWSDGLHIGYAEHKVLRTLTMLMDTCGGCKAVTVESAPGAGDYQRWGSFVISHYSAV